MTMAYTRLLPALALAAIVAGCAGDDAGGLFSTAAISPIAPPPPPAAAAVAPAPKIDTACLQLANQIDAIKKDGTIERLEKVAAGKTTSVQVKRASLAKQTELNRANADYMAKCGPGAGRTAAAPAPTVAPAQAPAAAKAAAAAVTPARAATGVTVAPPKTQ